MVSVTQKRSVGNTTAFGNDDHADTIQSAHQANCERVQTGGGQLPRVDAAGSDYLSDHAIALGFEPETFRL